MHDSPQTGTDLANLLHDGIRLVHSRDRQVLDICSGSLQHQALPARMAQIHPLLRPVPVRRRQRGIPHLLLYTLGKV